jgi:hypothetical protein
VLGLLVALGRVLLVVELIDHHLVLLPVLFLPVLVLVLVRYLHLCPAHVSLCLLDQCLPRLALLMCEAVLGALPTVLPLCPCKKHQYLLPRA